MKDVPTDKRAERIAREERQDSEVRLARALGHPLRVAILESLNSDGPMAPVEVADLLDADLSNLSYHFRVLVEGGLIEELRREKVRGRIKTTYRSTARALIEGSAWAALSRSTRADISVTIFDVLSQRVSEALLADTFDSKDDRHLSISTIAVDEKGWEETTELLNAALHRIQAIQAESRRRGGRLKPLSVGLLGFESPRMYE